ncbi:MULTISPECIES: DUF5959 family protein [unclassified Streptomyces]|uniref:DUF5959 family protein n=1 Tax=unclassified Streptomyces TaxID=2593676 RepID=UPI003664085B
MDLIRLIESDSSVRLRMLGRTRPGNTPYNDCLDAELVITSTYASGPLGLCLSLKPWMTGRRPWMNQAARPTCTWHQCQL